MASRGRKAFEPSEEQVATARKMLASGARWKAIASAIGVSEPTARKVFGDAPAPKAENPDLFASTLSAPSAPRAPRAGAGRKRWKPGHFDREKVALYVAAGMSVEDIGRVFGKSAPTIRRVFAEEFRTGAARKEAELLEAMMRGAKAGNASMAAKLDEKFARARLAETSRDFTDRQANAAPPSPPQDPPPRGPVGKKQEQQDDAVTAASDPDWQGLLQPRVRLN